MKVMIIGAHPDDCELSAGGSAALWRRRGDDVYFVSVTDGRRGHFYEEYIRDPQLLIDRRRAESLAAAAVIGATCANFGVPDGDLYVDRETTYAMVREIRAFRPDLVVTNRPVDYHRDHRYTAQLVLDATYMLTVPAMCPDVPILARMPVFCYWHDGFTEVTPFRADKIVAIDSVLETKTLMVAAHESQLFEWLPFNGGRLDEVPSDPAERIAGIRKNTVERRGANIRAACLGLIHGAMPDGEYVEAFQICEYGHKPSAEELEGLFP